MKKVSTGCSELVSRPAQFFTIDPEWALANDPLTRPAPAEENAGGGPPSPPRGRGACISAKGTC
jgi:hypothetical protein